MPWDSRIRLPPVSQADELLYLTSLSSAIRWLQVSATVVPACKACSATHSPTLLSILGT